MRQSRNRLGLSILAFLGSGSVVLAGDGLACTHVGVELFDYFPDAFNTPIEYEQVLLTNDDYLITYSNEEIMGFFVVGPEGVPDGSGQQVEGIVDAAVQNGIAYVTSDDALLRSFDVSNRNNIIAVHDVQLSKMLDQLTLDAGVLAGRSGEQGVLIIDAQNPQSMVVASELDMVSDVLAVSMRAHLLCVAIGNGEVHLYDVSDPYLPAFMGKVSGLVVSDVHELAQAQGWLYSFSETGLDVLDIRNPSDPVIASSSLYDDLLDGFMVNTRSLNATHLEDDLLGVAFGDGGGFVFDITNRSSPMLIAQQDMTAREKGIALRDEQLVLLSNNGEVYKSDIDELNAANPIVQNSFFTTGGAFNDIDIDGDTLYASGATYSVHDITDLETPIQTESFQFESETVFGAVQYQGYSILAAGSVGLVIIDHERPEGQREVLRYNPLNNIIGVHRDGRDLLVVDESGTMILMDISFPELPLIRSVVSLPYDLERGTIIFDDLHVYAISNIEENESLGISVDWTQLFQPLLRIERLDHNYHQMAMGTNMFYAISSSEEGGIGYLERDDLREEYFMEFPQSLASVRVLDDQRVLVGDASGQLTLFDQYPYIDAIGAVQSRYGFDSNISAIGHADGYAFIGFEYSSRIRVVDVSERCAACPADLDHDGQVDFFDVAAFIQAFNALDPSADLNRDGDWDFFDVAEYLNMVQYDCGDPFH